MGFSIWHLLVVLLIIVLLFGTKKLASIGKDMGGAVKGFRDAMRNPNEDEEEEGKEAAPSQSGRYAEGGRGQGRVAREEPGLNCAMHGSPLNVARFHYPSDRSPGREHARVRVPVEFTLSRPGRPLGLPSRCSILGSVKFWIISVVAILVVGPKEFPALVRTFGRWMGKARSVAGEME